MDQVVLFDNSIAFHPQQLKVLLGGCGFRRGVLRGDGVLREHRVLIGGWEQPQIRDVFCASSRRRSVDGVRRATEQCLGLLCTICRWSPELWLAAEGSG